MNDDELEGVIAHELSHVRNYDILISSIAATIAGAITWIAYWGPYRDDGEGGGGGGLLGLLMMILAPLAAMLLQLGLSRQREYSTSRSGAIGPAPGSSAVPQHGARKSTRLNSRHTVIAYAVF